MILEHQHDLLWSINERLGGRNGMDVPRLGPDWIDILTGIAAVEAEDMEATHGDSD